MTLTGALWMTLIFIEVCNDDMVGTVLYLSIRKIAIIYEALSCKILGALVSYPALVWVKGMATTI